MSAYQPRPCRPATTRAVGLETVAFYSAFTLITAIVLGTLSLRPF